MSQAPVTRLHGWGCASAAQGKGRCAEWCGNLNCPSTHVEPPPRRGLFRTDTEGLDECLSLMFPDLQPGDFRTEGGNINMPKVRMLWRERNAGVGETSAEAQQVGNSDGS